MIMATVGSRPAQSMLGSSRMASATFNRISSYPRQFGIKGRKESIGRLLLRDLTLRSKARCDCMSQSHVGYSLSEGGGGGGGVI